MRCDHVTHGIRRFGFTSQCCFYIQRKLLKRKSETWILINGQVIRNQ